MKNLYDANFHHSLHQCLHMLHHHSHSLHHCHSYLRYPWVCSSHAWQPTSCYLQHEQHWPDLSASDASDMNHDEQVEACLEMHKTYSSPCALILVMLQHNRPVDFIWHSSWCSFLGCGHIQHVLTIITLNVKASHQSSLYRFILSQGEFTIFTLFTSCVRNNCSKKFHINESITSRISITTIAFFFVIKFCGMIRSTSITFKVILKIIFTTTIITFIFL